MPVLKRISMLTQTGTQLFKLCPCRPKKKYIVPVGKFFITVQKIQLQVLPRAMKQYKITVA